MTPIENTSSMPIKTFLGASREYFGVAPEKPANKQQSSLSGITSSSQRTPMNTYRKVFQSLLLAAGIGTFMAAPAMANQNCSYMGEYGGHHAKMMERYRARLHDALKLTAEQEAGWKKMIDAERPGPAMKRGTREDWAKLNAPERAEKMLELHKARQAQMTEHVAALKSFYTSLSPEQQKAFDDYHAPRNRKGDKPGPMTPNKDKAPINP